MAQAPRRAQPERTDAQARRDAVATCAPPVPTTAAPQAPPCRIAASGGLHGRTAHSRQARHRSLFVALRRRGPRAGAPRRRLLGQVRERPAVHLRTSYKQLNQAGHVPVPRGGVNRPPRTLRLTKFSHKSAVHVQTPPPAPCSMSANTQGRWPSSTARYNGLVTTWYPPAAAAEHARAARDAPPRATNLEDTRGPAVGGSDGGACRQASS